MAEPTPSSSSFVTHRTREYGQELDALPYPQGHESPTLGKSRKPHDAHASGVTVVDQPESHVADSDALPVEEDARVYFAQHLSGIIEPQHNDVRLAGWDLDPSVSKIDRPRIHEERYPEPSEPIPETPSREQMLTRVEGNHPKPPIGVLPPTQLGTPHSQPDSGLQIQLDHPPMDTSYLNVLSSNREARHRGSYTPGSLLPIQSPPDFEALSPIPLTPRGQTSGSGSGTSDNTVLGTPPLGSGPAMRSSWSPTTDGYDGGEEVKNQDMGVQVPKSSRWPRVPLKWRNFSGGENQHKLPLEEGHHPMGRSSRRGTRFKIMQGWPGYKWVLFLSVVIVSLLGAIGLLFGILTWWRAWNYAGVMAIADSDLLLLITFTSAFFLITSFLGSSGTLVDSRPLLTMYTIFQLLCLALVTAVFYLSHRRATLILPENLQLSWTRVYTPTDRLIIQNAFHCCGYRDAFQSGTRSEDCHTGTTLPGCREAFVNFETRNLGKMWRGAAVCGLIFLVDMFVGCLCAQRLTSVFASGGAWKGGKGEGGQTRRILEKLRSFRLGRGESVGSMTAGDRNGAVGEDAVRDMRKPEASRPRPRAETRAVSSGVDHEGQNQNERTAGLSGRNAGEYDREYFPKAHYHGYAM